MMKEDHYFFIGSFLAVRCCRSQLDGCAYPSGSHVRLRLCFANYFGEHFIGFLN